jgi:hypothetical protein
MMKDFYQNFELLGRRSLADSQDWEVLSMLCALGKLSMVTSASIIHQAVNANRLDVLLMVAERVHDLSELDAIFLIKLVGSINQEVLVSP